MDSYPIWEIQKDLSGGKTAYHLWKYIETSPPYLFAMGKLAHYGRINGWMDGTRQDEYPHLYSFAKNKDISFVEAINNNNGSIYNLFHLPLSTVAHEELTSLQNDMQEQDLSGDNDI
jgi:hypothetical protein